MSVVVITPPDGAIVAASDARTAGVFTSADSDDLVNALLSAAQGTIDGPDGWLGRAIGLQTLELTTSPWASNPVWCSAVPFGLRLPYPPVRSITSAKYTDGAAVEHTLDPSSYSLKNSLLTFVAAPPVYPLRIQYQAGYGAADDGTNLALPGPIKHAILLMAAQLKNAGGSVGQVIREEVSGVSSFMYASPEAASKVLNGAAENLLSTFRLFV